MLSISSTGGDLGTNSQSRTVWNPGHGDSDDNADDDDADEDTIVTVMMMMMMMIKLYSMSKFPIKNSFESVPT